ncbi:3-deoxy-D-arabino-heptulosonate 7-phosphate synthase [Achromobacter spanius]|uniref:3-deoxy-D-arabino-heptulosonate 7-phosphate synthase n=1 Tax=Achromobacter spanius TaxID=217203 RepID=UPI00320BA7BC
MPQSLTPSLLDHTLRIVARRYRLQDLPDPTPGMQESDPSTALAIAIEQARASLARGEAPAAAPRRLFIGALACLIRTALREPNGDAVFQAMVLRHRAPRVREHASLCAHAGRDRRAVRTAVDALAHPGKRRSLSPGPIPDALAQLHAAASSASWTVLADQAARLLAMPDAVVDTPIRQGLVRLQNDPALARLKRLDELASDPLVQRYQALWDRQGPRPGSAQAAEQGATSRRRGDAVEAMAATTLDTLARVLAKDEGEPYRVATSLRVPSSMPGDPERAKTEWDVALLRQAGDAGAAHAGAARAGAAWEVRLLVEAKASVDAATTDLPRLVRGLRLLAKADEDTAYAFGSRQGTMLLHGASLSALKTDEAALAATVLYFCDAPAETVPRLLGAASRMQLLSAPASLEFASRLADGQDAQALALEPIWLELVASPRWGAVLNQYPLLRQVRALMVHPDDLRAAIDAASRRAA